MPERVRRSQAESVNCPASGFKDDICTESAKTTRKILTRRTGGFITNQVDCLLGYMIVIHGHMITKNFALDQVSADALESIVDRLPVPKPSQSLAVRLALYHFSNLPDDGIESVVRGYLEARKR